MTDFNQMFPWPDFDSEQRAKSDRQLNHVTALLRDLCEHLLQDNGPALRRPQFSWYRVDVELEAKSSKSFSHERSKKRQALLDELDKIALEYERTGKL